MFAIEAIHSRRSVRDYSAQPVERELIEDLLSDTAQAPPRFARQTPWTFNVIDGHLAAKQAIPGSAFCARRKVS